MARLGAMQQAVTTVDDEMIQPIGKGRAGGGSGGRGVNGAGREVGGTRMSKEEREAARGEAWGGQVRAVRRAITTAMKGGKTGKEDWEAVRQLLGGVVRQPRVAGEWNEREMRGRIAGIAENIAMLQDLVWGGIRVWKSKTSKERGEYIQWEERARVAEEEQRGWRVQRKKGRKGRVQVEGRRADWEAMVSADHARCG